MRLILRGSRASGAQARSAFHVLLRLHVKRIPEPSCDMLGLWLYSGVVQSELNGAAALTCAVGPSILFSPFFWYTSWGFDAVGRGEVGITARWHYDKLFSRRPTVLGSTFMGGKAKV